MEGPFSVWPAVADGNGGAKLVGGQNVRLPGAQAALNLSRLVTVSNLARGARIASGLLGPIALAGLAYEGITWAVDHWEVPDPEAPAVNPVGTLYLWTACLAVNGIGNYATGTWGSGGMLENGVQTTVTVILDTDTVPSGWTVLQACTQKPPYDWNRATGQWPLLIGSQSASPPEPSMLAASNEQVEDALSDALAADPNKAPEVLRKVVEAVAPLDLDPGPLQVTGPSSVNGPTSSTTQVGASGTTTINRNVTYNLTYNGGNVTITETVETTTIYPDESESTETTTTTAGDGAGEEGPPTDFCKDNPTALACAELGDENPDEPELPEEDRDFEFASEMTAVGECPAPIELSILGSTHSLAWTPLCDLASGVRPVVIALAWLGAAVFVFSVGSRAT